MLADYVLGSQKIPNVHLGLFGKKILRTSGIKC